MSTNSTKWVLDPTHSEIQFKVKHLMITTVTGSFRNFEGSVQSNGNDFSAASIQFSAAADSVTTGNEQRDGHLLSPDFFDTANSPRIEFQSTAVVKVSNDEFEVTGNLAMHGVSKEVKLQVEFAGLAKDPWGNEKAGFTINGKINRKDWNLNWNAALEAGGLLVSDEVKIVCEVQIVKQA